MLFEIFIPLFTAANYFNITVSNKNGVAKTRVRVTPRVRVRVGGGGEGEELR